MNPARQSAIRWGVIIGAANLLWLYVAYYVGLHTNGIAIFQVFMAGWLVLQEAQ